jgi:hypothetical protein
LPVLMACVHIHASRPITLVGPPGYHDQDAIPSRASMTQSLHSRFQNRVELVGPTLAVNLASLLRRRLMYLARHTSSVGMRGTTTGKRPCSTADRSDKPPLLSMREIHRYDRQSRKLRPRKDGIPERAVLRSTGADPSVHATVQRHTTQRHVMTGQSFSRYKKQGKRTQGKRAA